MSNKPKYLLAVSGGVDSMVLLHKWRHKALAVAHVDHGIRPDSFLDLELVRDAAKKYNLLFYSTSLKLGIDASEEKARVGRYSYLRALAGELRAEIVTAHHQNDLIETAILQVDRGSGVYGVVNMLHNTSIIRPFLGVYKVELIKYAKQNKLEWREDSTNTNFKYRRNYVRNKLDSNPKLRSETLDIIGQSDRIIRDIEFLLKDYSIQDRGAFCVLPNVVANFLMWHSLKKIGITHNHTRIQRIVVQVKTLKPNTSVDIGNKIMLKIVLNSPSSASIIFLEE